MGAFRFRLETVLRLRIADRQQRRLELAQAFQAERLLQQQAEALSLELGTARNRYRETAAPGELDVDRLLEIQRYALHVLAQTKVLAQQQTTVREELERRRQALTEADRQVRTLENLRTKQQEAFRLGELKIEQKVLDEVAGRKRTF